jgi:Ulp1 protease family, C-terminal catalytic domain
LNNRGLNLSLAPGVLLGQVFFMATEFFRIRLLVLNSLQSGNQTLSEKTVVNLKQLYTNVDIKLLPVKNQIPPPLLSYCFDLMEYETPQQNNCDDCGIFTCHFADVIINNKKLFGGLFEKWDQLQPETFAVDWQFSRISFLRNIYYSWLTLR